MSDLLMIRPKAVTLNVRQRTQHLLSVLNLHWVGVGTLVLINLYLLINVGLLWQQAKNQDAEALGRQRIALTAAQLAARPLTGLDAKLQVAREQSDIFYAERLPVTYSDIASELGVLKDRDHVRLSSLRYAQAPVVGDAAGQLTEVRMDASLTGQYRGLIEFLNGLERDRMFFVINNITLTGQQSGTVSLRLRLTTYLRGVSSDDEAKQASTPGSLAQDVDSASAAGGRR